MQTTITVKRPTGEIETIDVSDRYHGLNDKLFARIKEQTAAAGRGEVLSWQTTEDAPDSHLAETMIVEARLERALARNDAAAATKARFELADLEARTNR